jgi:DNA-binding NarL/FixJ family response regulator
LSAPRVLILSSQALFAESLRSLLEREGCDVIGARAYDEHIPDFVATLKPTVVVLDTQNAPPAATADLLACAPNIRIVHVSLQDQVIATYDRHQPVAPSVQKFLDLVALRDQLPPDVEVSSADPESPGTEDL